MNFPVNLGHFWRRMIFGTSGKKITMQSRSSSSTLLLVLIIIVTFPLWVGLAGGLIGIVAGVFGAVIGIIAGVFGALFGAIGGIFGWIFDWSWPFDGFFHWNIFSILILVLIVVLVSRSRRI